MKYFASVILLMLIMINVAISKPIASIKLYWGDVKVKVNNKWIKAEMNMKLGTDDVIIVKKGAYIQLKTSYGIYSVKGPIKLNGKDALSKSKSNNKYSNKITALKRKLGKINNYNVNSPTAVAGVRGSDISSIDDSIIKPSDLIWEE